MLTLLKDRGMNEFTLEQLNQYMMNIGREQFDYETLKAAYDSDPRINEIIKDFTQDTIELKTSEVDDLKLKKKRRDKNKVSTMAKKATDVGDKL